MVVKDLFPLFLKGTWVPVLKCNFKNILFGFRICGQGGNYDCMGWASCQESKVK